MRFSIFQPAYVCLPLSLSCLTFCVCVRVCVSIDCLRRTMRLLALGCSCRRRTLAHRQQHIATPSTHTHTHTDTHTHSPADGLRVVRPFSNFAASSSRGALHVISPSLPLSLSLPLSTIGFRVLCARHRHHHHQQTGNIGKFMAIGIREHRF